MAFVNLSGVSIAFGDRDVLKDANLNINQSTRAAIAGANGSGKTTFLKIMAGVTAPDRGTMTVQKGTRISYLPQAGLSHSGLTLMEETEKSFSYFHSLLEKREIIGRRLENYRERQRRRLSVLSRRSMKSRNSFWKAASTTGMR